MRRNIFEILYQVCPRCTASHIRTDDGLVEVPHEHVAAIENEAHKVEIFPEEMVRGEALSADQLAGDIPAHVQVKVFARDGHACAHCGKRMDLHMHHIIFKSQHGPSELWNCVLVCKECHSFIHGGTLEVFRDSRGELHWRTRAERIDKLLEDEIAELAAVPSPVMVVDARAAREAAPPAMVPRPLIASPEEKPGAGKPAAWTPPSVRWRREEDLVARAVQKTGHTASEARRRVAWALRALGDLGRAPTGDEIFQTAVYGRRMVLGPAPASGPSSRRSGDAETSGGGAAANGDSTAGGAEKGSEGGRDASAAGN